MQTQEHRYEVVWLYDNGLESTTGQQVSLPARPSEADILSAIETAGFHGLKVRRNDPASAIRVLTTSGVMALRALSR